MSLFVKKVFGMSAVEQQVNTYSAIVLCSFRAKIDLLSSNMFTIQQSNGRVTLLRMFNHSTPEFKIVEKIFYYSTDSRANMNVSTSKIDCKLSMCYN